MRIVLPLLAALAAVVACPALASGNAAGWPRTSQGDLLPTDAPGQVEWLGDLYATSLVTFWPEGLSPGSVATSRQEFTERLRAHLLAPLSPAELWEIGDWLFRMGSYPKRWPIAPDLELKKTARSRAHIISLYLQRPLRTPEERYPIWVQVGELMGCLHGALVQEFTGLDEPDALVEGAAVSVMPMLWRALLSPVSPELTRPFTPEEIESLKGRARYHATRAGQEATRHCQELAAQGLDTSGLARDAARSAITAAVMQFHNEMRNLQYIPPAFLSPAEEDANRQARLRAFDSDAGQVIIDPPHEAVELEGGSR